MDKVFYSNPYGVKIVKCCASCSHKKFDKGSMRVCVRGFGAVRSSFLCPEWQMHDNLRNAGKGGGKVKKIEYLHYAINARVADDALAMERAEKKQFHQRISNAQIRNDWEKTHGTIYINNK